MHETTIYNENITVMNICISNGTATTTTKHKLQKMQEDINKTH